MCPITINKALLLQEGILRFELSWTAVPWNNYAAQNPQRNTVINGHLRRVLTISKNIAEETADEYI